jgi:hypothetical protein
MTAAGPAHLDTAVCTHPQHTAQVAAQHLQQGWTTGTQPCCCHCCHCCHHCCHCCRRQLLELCCHRQQVPDPHAPLHPAASQPSVCCHHCCHCCRHCHHHCCCCCCLCVLRGRQWQPQGLSVGCSFDQSRQLVPAAHQAPQASGVRCHHLLPLLLQTAAGRGVGAAATEPGYVKTPCRQGEGGGRESGESGQHAYPQKPR